MVCSIGSWLSGTEEGESDCPPTLSVLYKILIVRFFQLKYGNLKPLILGNIYAPRGENLL